jgi:hypothetical protein
MIVALGVPGATEEVALGAFRPWRPHPVGTTMSGLRRFGDRAADVTRRTVDRSALGGEHSVEGVVGAVGRCMTDSGS